MLTGLVGCNRLPDKDYKDFNHINHWDDFEKYDEKVIVFYYSQYCQICIGLQDEVTERLVVLEQNTRVVLIKDGLIRGQGQAPYEDIEVPSLMIYENGQFVKIVSGSRPISDYLKEITKK